MISTSPKNLGFHKSRHLFLRLKYFFLEQIFPCVMTVNRLSVYIVYTLFSVVWDAILNSITVALQNVFSQTFTNSLRHTHLIRRTFSISFFLDSKSGNKLSLT